MNFGGHLKVTLLDFPDHVATTLFTNGCNMRCPFCHNAHLVCECDQVIATEEIVSYLNKRKAVLEGVCISGGEPLLQKDIVEFITLVKDMGYSVKLDTNGTSYEKLLYLVENNLVDYVAMDIKNSKELYDTTCGCHVDIDEICRCVDLLKQGKVAYEFRTTLCHPLHTQESVADMAKWLAGCRAWYLQQFEDSGNLIGSNMLPFDKPSMETLLQVASKHCSTVQLRGVK